MPALSWLCQSERNASRKARASGGVVGVGADVSDGRGVWVAGGAVVPGAVVFVGGGGWVPRDAIAPDADGFEVWGEMLPPEHANLCGICVPMY